MTEREALKLALEALKRATNYDPVIARAITAIKEALAQPEHGWTPERIAGIARLKDAQDKRLAQPSVSVEQEPVYWQWRRKNQPWSLEYVFNSEVKVTTEDSERRALYTTPPQRLPLTDEEIILIVAECAASHQHTDIHFARAIERAHGIKELV